MTADVQSSLPQRPGLFSEQAIDVRAICAMRLLLACTALLIVYLDPSEPNRFAAVTYAALILYAVYSAVLDVLAIRRSRHLPLEIMHWLDVAWYIPLIALTGGTNSVFFFFFFFAILVASFAWGFSSGMRVTVISSALYTVVASATTPAADFELNRFLLRPIYLLILGYMVAHWGGFEIRLRRRLGFLREVTDLANPRFGIERTTSAVLEGLRSLYSADSCLLIMPGKHGLDGPYQLHRVSRMSSGQIGMPEEITEEIARIFLLPSPGAALIYRKTWPAKTCAYDLRTGKFSKDDHLSCDKVANTLDARSFLAVPVRDRNQALGCLYVIGGPRTFDHSDADFVLQLIDHITPVMENIKLVDNLASDAAEQERRRIAHDIHDSVIQPYLGLQFGLAAIHQKLGAGKSNVVQDVRQLLDLTNEELAELRSFVWGLRAGEQRRDVLLPSLQRFAAKFAAVTGIDVDVETDGELPANDRLAGELFQIVAEGLSNVRRHTHSRHAKVQIACRDGKIQLQIKNNHLRANGNGVFASNGGRNAKVSFTPRSIAERAALLGGQTYVYTDENDYTVVSVGIPL